MSDRSGNRERSCTFVSLFCGTCSIESKVKGFDKVLCNDSHEYLIEMLKGVQNGYELPENISEEQYKEVEKIMESVLMNIMKYRFKEEI